MMIRHVIGQGVILIFPKSEQHIALAILKAINKSQNQDFIHEAIRDIEAEDAPKVLPHVNYFHICHHCCRDLDERDPNTYKMTTRNLKGEEDTKWVHYVCTPLKDKRP